ncbi:hypothetical protein Ahy_A02g005988 [Arachis hypogaea]|uniref:Uncharacterized protein n=1 Tax=Arachis hypogaea TaxID=3818 RepID=A0A445E8K5_ARAHY|nr:hypothetical protein Ahy_A02g005988 [Arachis hypogaea]
MCLKSEPPVHIQETIIIAGTIRHLTHNYNDLIARAEHYQLSYILPSQLGQPRLELETSLVKIPDKKTLEEPPTPTIVHVRSLLDLTNYVSYLLYVIDKKVSHVHVQETIITAWTIRHPTRNSNDPIARAKFYQQSYILPDQLGHPRLKLETSLVKANLILFPRIPDKKTLEEPLIPTIIHWHFSVLFFIT